MSHQKFIRECLRLAEQAVHHGNHPFGALLLKDGVVLLTAENTVNSEQDRVGHAELNLIRRASRQLGPEVMAGSTLYTSTEPCPMCAGAIYWAGISTVVFSCSAEALGRITGGEFIIPCREIFARGRRRIEVIGPILEEDSLKIHQGFWG